MSKKKRIISNRMSNWNSSEYMGGKHKCSVEDCNSFPSMTPSGPFCLMHYLTLRDCDTPGCTEPAIIDGLCRECAMPTPLTMQERHDIVTRSESPLAACQDEENIAAGKNGPNGGGLRSNAEKAIKKMGLSWDYRKCAPRQGRVKNAD